MFVRKMNSPQRAAVLATTTHTRQKDNVLATRPARSRCVS